MTMRFLLDTHFLIAILERRFARDYPRHASAVLGSASATAISVASLWEISIKTRIGKLRLDTQTSQIAHFFRDAGFDVIAINEEHAVAVVDPDPPMKDPFDRLLLAQAQVEGMRFVTADRALAQHPLVFAP
jgi:PIN domain nuclease of toxin-antitoxin system